MSANNTTNAAPKVRKRLDFDIYDSQNLSHHIVNDLTLFAEVSKKEINVHTQNIHSLPSNLKAISHGTVSVFLRDGDEWKRKLLTNVVYVPESPKCCLSLAVEGFTLEAQTKKLMRGEEIMGTYTQVEQVPAVSSWGRKEPQSAAIATIQAFVPGLLADNEVARLLRIDESQLHPTPHNKLRKTQRSVANTSGEPSAHDDPNRKLVTFNVSEKKEQIFISVMDKNVLPPSDSNTLRPFSAFFHLGEFWDFSVISHVCHDDSIEYNAFLLNDSVGKTSSEIPVYSRRPPHNFVHRHGHNGKIARIKGKKGAKETIAAFRLESVTNEEVEKLLRNKPDTTNFGINPY